MSAERFYRPDAHVWRVGPDNPAIGHKVRCTWLKSWGGHAAGFCVTGELRATLAVNAGRTLVGEILGLADSEDFRSGARKYSAPWSRNYLRVEVLS
ncbi:MAG: hypothetical protein KGL39_09600 [Patescibacteria group bacterium]|nr:hypothetical protein [Patescibacteria group bacterium]